MTDLAAPPERRQLRHFPDSLLCGLIETCIWNQQVMIEQGFFQGDPRRIEEFMTVALRGGRRQGHTTQVAEAAIEFDALVLLNGWYRYDTVLRGFGVRRQRVVTLGNPHWYDRLRGRRERIVIVDDASRLTTQQSEDLRMLCGSQLIADSSTPFVLALVG